MIQKKYQEILDSFVQSGKAAGCAVLLYKDGKELACASSGVRDLDLTDPFDRKTVMLMYSMTKVVTAAAVMTLWDKGLLTPETAVSEIIPEFADLTVVDGNNGLRKAQNVMRVKHLLTMTSGIPYHWEGGAAGECVRAMFAELNAPEYEDKT